MNKTIKLVLLVLLSFVGSIALKAQDQFLGEIRMFAGNFAPQGWYMCDGRILSIAQNSALFSILGTTYGGDGQTTFALPNLCGRVPVGAGNGTGLTAKVLGEQAGQENVALKSTEVAPHTHALEVSSTTATTNVPSSSVTLASPPNIGVVKSKIYATPSSPEVPLSGTTVAPNVQTVQAHNNMMPYVVINYIIAYTGIYPSRP